MHNLKFLFIAILKFNKGTRYIHRWPFNDSDIIYALLSFIVHVKSMLYRRGQWEVLLHPEFQSIQNTVSAVASL